jgi:ABC-type multidrug transport system fused ATPase/permease subunit
MPRDYRQIEYRPPREDLHETAGAWRASVGFLWHYVRPMRWRVLAGVLLLSLNACSGYLLAYYSQIVVDDILVIDTATRPAQTTERAPSVTAHNHRRAARPRPRHGDEHERARAQRASPRPPAAMASLMGMAALFLLTLGAVNTAARFSIRLRIGISSAITRAMRDDLHQKVLSLSKRYHERHPPGRLLARILSDVDAMRQMLLQTVFQAGQQIAMVAVGFVILASIEWRMALCVAAILVPYTWLVHRYQTRIVPVNREIRHTNACLYGYAAQKLDAVRALFAYGREPHERLAFRRLVHVMFRDILLQERYGALLNMWAALLTAGATLGLFLVGARLVMQGDMTLGRMLFVYSVTATVFAPIVSLAQLAVVVSSLMVLAQRLRHIMEEPVEIREAPHAVEFPSPLRRGLSMRNVRFAYTGAPVLNGVTLDIPVGKWICIMGSSGSGKSTLLYLLSRLYDPQSGSITVDGIPLANLRFESLRRHMALVPQEAQIFTGTVRDNITYGDPDATPRQIMAAARAAECHDFIMSMPVQYETLVGERGATLSGGQRQRISIARALLTNPDVLLLDDVTSALDADTERRIQSTLARLMQGKTAVVVSQRVSMAMCCHEVCVLQNGAVAERGPHAELQTRDGFYARICRQQIHGSVSVASHTGKGFTTEAQRHGGEVA